jgi:PAS domain S-box-containing protein
MMYKEVYNALPHPVVTLHVENFSFSVEDANNCFYSAFLDDQIPGLSGRPYFSLFQSIFEDHPDDALECIKKSMKKSLLFLRPDQTKVMAFGLGNGDVKYLRFLHTPVQTSNENESFITQTIEDVTDYVLEEQNQKDRIRYQNVLLEACRSFVTALFRSDNRENDLSEAFSILGKAIHADRVYYFEIPESADNGQHVISQKAEWSCDSVTSQINNPDLKNTSPEGFRLCSTRLRNGNPFQAVTEHLNNEAFKQTLTEQNVKSFLLVPVFLNETFHGFIGCDDCKNKRIWNSQEVQFLETIALNLSYAIERRKNTLSLRENRKKYRSLIHNLPGITYRCKADDYWTMEFMSDQTEKITGYPKEDFIKNKKRSFLSIIHPDDRHITFDIIPEIHNNETFSINYRIVQPGGSIRFMQENGRGIFNDEGNLVYVEGVIFDITDKISAGEMFRAVFENSTDAILLTDDNADYLMVNNSAINLFGYSKEEFLSMNVSDLIPDMERSRFSEIWSAFIASERQSWRIELSKRDKTTLIAEFKARANILRGIHLSVISDITERVNQEEALQQSERRLKALVEKGMDLIAIISPDGTYKYVADSSEEVLGIAPQYFIGKNAFSFIHPDDVKTVFEKLSQLKEHKQIFIGPFRFKDAGNHWRWIETTATDFQDDAAIDGIVTNSRDVTDKTNREHQKKLMESIRKQLSLSADLKEALEGITKKLVEFGGVALGEAWILSEDKNHIKLVVQHANSKKAKTFKNGTQYLAQFRKGEGLPGVTWKEGSYQVWESLENHPGFVRKKEAGLSALKNGYGIPILFDNEVIAVFTFITNQTKKELVQFEKILSELNSQIGTALQQKKTAHELNRFFDLTPDLLCIAGFDGYFKKINPAFEKILGYPKKEILEKPISDLLHPDDIDKTRHEIQHISANNPTTQFINRYRCKDGRYVWISWAASPLYYEGIMFAIGTDITRLKKSEQELKKAYTQLQTAQKIAKIGYWTRDLRTEISEWSEEVYNIYELDRQAFTPIQSEVIKYYHPEDRHLTDYKVHEYKKRDGFETFEHRIITGNGNLKWLAERFQILYNENGTPIKAEGMVQDISDIKEKEEQLRISNERFGMAMKATEEMIWDWDITSNRVTRGPGFNSIFGYTTDDANSVQEFWFENVHPDDRKEVKQSLMNALQDPDQSQWHSEYRFIKADGNIAHIIDRGYVIRDEDGIAIRVVGAILDVSDSRRMMREITFQNERLKEIAWTQSHIVRAPLARIMGLISALESDIAEGKETEKLLSEISSSARELDTIIRDIIKKTENLE